MAFSDCAACQVEVAASTSAGRGPFSAAVVARAGEGTLPFAPADVVVAFNDSVSAFSVSWTAVDEVALPGSLQGYIAFFWRVCCMCCVRKRVYRTLMCKPFVRT